MGSSADVKAQGRHIDDFGWHLGVLLRGYRDVVTPALVQLPHGMRGYEVLAAVVRGDQPSQLALAEHLGIDRTVMTYLIDDLVEAGLVERQQSATDRRARRIVATMLGNRALRELDRKVSRAEDSLLRALDETERTALRGLLRRVACDLREIDPDGASREDACTVVERALTD